MVRLQARELMRWKERNSMKFENGDWETVISKSDEVVGRRKEGGGVGRK